MPNIVRRLLVPLVALVTAFGVVGATTTTAFAISGESSKWSVETFGGASTQSGDTVSETRGATEDETLVDVYESVDGNHQVLISVDDGTAFTVQTFDNANGYTTVAPRVIYSNGWFYAFYTGTNQLVYWTRVADARIPALRDPQAGTASYWSPWRPIAGSNISTAQSVSLASSPSGLMMAWRGAGSNVNVYEAWLPVGTDTWSQPAQIGDGYSNSAPVITFDSGSNQFYAAIRGYTDNRVYFATQHLGSSTWSGYTQLPSIETYTSPVVTAVQPGQILFTATDANGYIWFQTWNNINGYGGWSSESQRWQTNYAPFISVAEGIAYILITGLYQNVVYWKQAWQPGT
jgi:hypothetical protein